MNYLDLFGDSGRGIEVPFSDPDFYALDGVCEDDVEATCPYVGMLPEESKGEEPSPLNFGKTYSIPLRT
jgi:hypothetical protein